MTAATLDKFRFRLRWWCAKCTILPADAPPAWQPLLDELVADGVADRRGDGSLLPRPNPRCRQYTDDAAARITSAMHLILSTLEDEAEVSSRRWFPLGADAGINRDHVDLAHSWLGQDGLIVTRDGITRPTQALWWARPKAAPAPASASSPAPSTPPSPPAPALDFDDDEPPRPAAAPEPRRAPPPQPPKPAPAKPAPVQPKSAPAPAPRPSPPVQVPAPAPAPAAAADTDEALALLQRLAFAAEVTAGLVAPPQRIRTPLSSSPLLETQWRIAVVLAAAGRPLLASEIKRGHLTKAQQTFAANALADGVRRGAFAVAGHRAGWGARYSLADPEPLDATWESVNAAAAAIRSRNLGQRPT